jgi:hypothetical protein
MASKLATDRRSSRRTMASRYDAEKQEVKALRKAGPVVTYVDPELAADVKARAKPAPTHWRFPSL